MQRSSVPIMRILAAALTILLVYSMIVSVAVATSPIKPAPDLTTKEVSFPGSDGITLHGTILEPVTAQAGRPGIVLVHGSGSGLPRSKLLIEATAFAQHGLSVLIYDKRSVGYSGFQRSYAQLAADALGAVRTLRAQPGVDPAKVGIWGVSEGGWVAPLAASQSDDIAFVIVVGANAMAPLRQQTWAVASALHRDGVSGSLINRAEPNMFRLLANAGLFAEAYYNAATVLRHVRQPFLGIWGSNDLSTPAEENPPLFARALRQGGNTHYTFRFFPGADHAIHQTPDGGITRLPSLAPGYVEFVGSWVGAVTNGRLPNADAPTPPRQSLASVPVPPSSWWESAWIQFVAFVLLMIAFIGYLLGALARRMSNRSFPTPVNNPALLMAGMGAGTVLGFFGYIIYLLSMEMNIAQKTVPGLLLLGRPLPWLLLQGLALTIIGASIKIVLIWRQTSVSVSRSERLQLGLLLIGSAIFVPWALYWGLLF